MYKIDTNIQAEMEFHFVGFCVWNGTLRLVLSKIGKPDLAPLDLTEQQTVKPTWRTLGKHQISEAPSECDQCGVDLNTRIEVYIQMYFPDHKDAPAQDGQPI